MATVKHRKITYVALNINQDSIAIALISSDACVTGVTHIYFIWEITSELKHIFDNLWHFKLAI